MSHLGNVCLRGVPRCGFSLPPLETALDPNDPLLGQLGAMSEVDFAKASGMSRSEVAAEVGPSMPSPSGAPGRRNAARFRLCPAAARTQRADRPRSFDRDAPCPSSGDAGNHADLVVPAAEGRGVPQPIQSPGNTVGA
jgi:hypothetical protein